MEPKVFESYIKIWSTALVKQISEFRKLGKKVYVIALSRKMPRFFDWMRKDMPFEEVRRLFEIIDSEDVEITTEYAIPLIYEDSHRKNVEVAGIVVDDVIIFGATANRVCTQWKAFFKEYPILMALFRSNKANIPAHLESDFLIKMDRQSFNLLDDCIEMISKRILSTSLPMDIEYPVIHIDRPYNEVVNFIKSHIPSEWSCYVVKSNMIEDSSESFSVVLGDGKELGYTNDFAKIRLFSKGEYCIMEIIAPSAVKIHDLYSPKLFLDSEGENNYAKSWRYVYGLLAYVIHHKGLTKPKNASISSTDEGFIYEAIVSLLALWAEYLYSLVAFIYNYGVLIPFDSKCCIDTDDIKLILGQTAAGKMVISLQDIINYRDSFKTEFSQAAFPEYVNPNEFRSLYTRKISAALKPESDVEKNLNSLFNVSHFSEDIFSLIGKQDMYGHHCFGESYESLFHRLQVNHHEDSDLMNKINLWIDMRIDESRIAPKYEFVYGSDNNQYVKRFFLCGSNKLPV